MCNNTKTFGVRRENKGGKLCGAQVKQSVELKFELEGKVLSQPRRTRKKSTLD